jgi:hypothetical protein
VPVGWWSAPISVARPAEDVGVGAVGCGDSACYLRVFGFPGKESTSKVCQADRSWPQI